ncbi:pseudouridine synthase [Xylariaceae sp. FL0594]|nr:pseudouridine synthase [Xylariaceae sp. FL0594]
MSGTETNYDRWTRVALIKRIRALEAKNGIIEPQEAVPSDPAAEVPPVASSSAEEAATDALSSGELQGRQEEQQATPGKHEIGLPKVRPRKKKEQRDFDPSKYSTRLVALKLAYLGKNYGGFEFQACAPEPTIEEELWKALVKSCLISPEDPDVVDFEPFGYTKCGRTDRGVSAFGQVIGIRLRSNRPLPQEPETETTITPSSPVVTNDVDAAVQGEEGVSAKEDAQKDADSTEKQPPKPKREWNDLEDELPYARLLNNILPPDIRVLAWCPTTPADFSARKDCVEREYRYFFTQPAFLPMPRSVEDPKLRAEQRTGAAPKDGWLDIEAMQRAAKKFEGLHDFRNFCKVDPSKSQQSFRRRIFSSDVVEVQDAGGASMPHLSGPEYIPVVPVEGRGSSSPKEPSRTVVSLLPDEEELGEEARKFPKVYCFRIRGSAFLWHQIRCMVSVLFLVGQGLEDPSVIDALLDVDAQPRRPEYNLASDVPLVLWDCVFTRDRDDPDCRDEMAWVRVGECSPLHAYGPTGLVDHLWAGWRERKIDELLSGQLLNLVTAQTDVTRRLSKAAPQYVRRRQRAFEGDSKARNVGKYVPLLKRRRLAAPQDFYEKYAKRKGFESSAHREQVYAERRAEMVVNKIAASRGAHEA